MARSFKLGDAAYRVGKKSTKTKSTDATTGAKTKVYTKAAGGTVTVTKSKSADAKNMRIGAAARKTAVKSYDAATGIKTVTYTKQGGGTVTKTITASADARKKGTPKKSTTT